MNSDGETTSTWATPPKKSVIRALVKGRLKRSLRTPGWEPILTTLYESNCTANTYDNRAGEMRIYTHEVLHRLLTSFIDGFHIFENVMCICINDSDSNVIVIRVLRGDKNLQLDIKITSCIPNKSSHPIQMSRWQGCSESIISNTSCSLGKYQS